MTKLDVTNSQIIEAKNSIYYNTNQSTLLLKQLAYDTLLDSKDLKLHQLYQKYIKLLEKELPFSIYKNSKFYRIENLLDENLVLFDGISVFDAKIENKVIVNNTKEKYIGNRSSFYINKFFIGKLLEVKVDDKSILDSVESYNFHKIRINYKNTNVKVTHLRAFPHYEMGVFMYLNQAKRKLKQ